LLDHFGVDSSAALGRGGEATVYALDAERVLRVPHAPVTRAENERRQAYLAELGQSAARVPFEIPRVLELVEIGTEVVSIERRLPGRALSEALGEVSGARREELIRAHLAAAARIGDLCVARDYFGDVNHPTPIRTTTLVEYLERRAAASLRAGSPSFAHINPRELACALPEPESPALVHLDAFAGNMLSDGSSITAVIDFGAISIIGDRRLDPVLTAVYLVPPHCQTAKPEDQRVCSDWLNEHGLAPMYDPARRWIAAYWSFARDDAALWDWCQSVLAR
jgi:aminoglycoside phosphotransferase (APT) family kinase protein